MQLNYVLISDGTSDRALIPIINFTLKKYHDSISFSGVRADFSRLLKEPKKLTEKIEAAIDLFEPTIVFVHRDAENEKISLRENEIGTAIKMIDLKRKFFKKLLLG